MDYIKNNHVLISKDIQKKVKQLQLHTKRIMHSFFVGDHRTKQKGYGIDFDQIREYHLGDDIRFIDWKSSARMDKMLVKQYIHEQVKKIILLVDVSASNGYGSSKLLKQEIMAQVSTILALAAQQDKAHIGLILFSEEIEFYIQPKSGNAHIQLILDTVWNFKPTHKKTDISKACSFVSKIARSDALVCIISDFIGDYKEATLNSISKKFDTIIIRCLDSYERSFPSVGFLHLEDTETGQKMVIDTRPYKKNSYKELFSERIIKQNNDFRKYGIDCFDVENNNHYIDALILFFARRIQR